MKIKNISLKLGEYLDILFFSGSEHVFDSGIVEKTTDHYSLATYYYIHVLGDCKCDVVYTRHKHSWVLVWLIPCHGHVVCEMLIHDNLYGALNMVSLTLF